MEPIQLPATQFNWLEERTILLAPTGSYAYGTNTENSDQDYKGICIPPISYYLGLDTFNQFSHSSGENFRRNTRDDIDVSISHLSKFVREAMLGVPNNIELLFMRAEDYLKMTELGQQLIDSRHLFLSKRIYAKYQGYATAQIRKLQVKKAQGTGRQDLVRQYGYDTKFFMHSVRLLTSAIEILETGDFCTYRPNRDLLLECRNGKYSFEEALEMVAQLDAQLQSSMARSPLPTKPDVDKLNQLLIHLNKQGLEIE